MPVTTATTSRWRLALAASSMTFCDGRGQFAGRIGMRTVADDHIQHDDRHLGILGFFIQAADAQFVIHHRVQAADGEFILAQVDDGVFLAGQGIGHLVCLY